MITKTSSNYHKILNARTRALVFKVIAIAAVQLIVAFGSILGFIWIAALIVKFVFFGH